MFKLYDDDDLCINYKHVALYVYTNNRRFHQYISHTQFTFKIALSTLITIKRTVLFTITFKF